MSAATLNRVNQGVEEEIKPHVNRNVATSIADGAINAIAVGMIPFETIIVYFVSEYVSSNFLVGLLTTMQLLFMAIPQFFTARHLIGKGYYKSLMGTLVIISRCQSLAISLLILLVAPYNNQLFVILFYATYWINGFILGANAITYSIFINKVIPFNKRARFFGTRGIFCSFGSIIGSILGGFILRHGSPDTRYAYLFLLSFFIDIISFIFIIMAYEPKVEVSGYDKNNKEFKKKVLSVLNRDKNLMKYIISYSLIMFALSVISYQTLYAKSSLGLASDKVSILATVIFVFQTIGYMVWGFVAHRFGFKACTLIGSCLFIPNLMIAIFNQGYFIMIVLAALYGLAISIRMIGGRNFIFSICTYENRPVYLSIFNSLFIPVTALAPLINGLLFDLLGFKLLCLVNLVLLCTGLIIMIKVRESVGMDDIEQNTPIPFDHAGTCRKSCRS